MILVDTSIWVNYFRGSEPDNAKLLEQLIRGRNRVAISGIILQEILQGIRSDKSYEHTKQKLSFLPFLDATREVFLLAASLYRDLRKRGITVPSTDVAIAAVALHYRIPLLSNDGHFTEISRFSDLKIFQETDL